MDFSLKKTNYLGLCWIIAATQAFSSCSEQGLLFFTVCGLLIAVVFPIVEHRL